MDGPCPILLFRFGRKIIPRCQSLRHHIKGKPMASPFLASLLLLPFLPHGHASWLMHPFPISPSVFHTFLPRLDMSKVCKALKCSIFLLCFASKWNRHSGTDCEKTSLHVNMPVIPSGRTNGACKIRRDNAAIPRSRAGGAKSAAARNAPEAYVRHSQRSLAYGTLWCEKLDGFSHGLSVRT